MRMLRSRFGIVVWSALAALLAWATPAVAQVGTEVLARQSLRPYWYVFVAYALAWSLISGWMFSIGRRMRDLGDGGAEDGGA